MITRNPEKVNNKQALTFPWNSHLHLFKWYDSICAASQTVKPSSKINELLVNLHELKAI